MLEAGTMVLSYRDSMEMPAVMLDAIMYAVHVRHEAEEQYKPKNTG